MYKFITSDFSALEFKLVSIKTFAMLQFDSLFVRPIKKKPN